MKTIISIFMLLLASMSLQAQVRHIKPSTVLALRDFPFDKYDQLQKIMADRKLTAAEEKTLEQFEDNVIFEELYSGHCSWYCGGQVDTITASSALKPSKSYTYEASNAHDFDHETAWVEGAQGHGIGEWLCYEFSGSCPRITTVKIMNGYIKSDKTWRDNGRVKSLLLYYNGEPYAILDLVDSRSLQCFDVGTLGFHDSDAPSWTLKFEIKEVYPGKKYADTAITELYFDGIDVH